MVISYFKINPTPSKRLEVLELLHYLQGPTRVAAGCLDCSVYESTDDQSVLYLEQWLTRDEMNMHIKSYEYMSVLAALELSHTAPEINFVEATETSGIELIKALRSV